jgi:predicted  nucleic acid-binding Zn-ribbon protein
LRRESQVEPERTVASVNSDLQTLIRLQELETAVTQVRGRLRRIPQELAELEQRLEVARRNVEEAAKNLEDGHKERRRLEGEVEVLRQRLSKFRAQQWEVKNNKEYEAVKHELAACEQEISRKEDIILEHMLQADEWERRARQARQELAAGASETSARRAELEAFLAQSESEISRLQEQMRAARAAIPAELVQQYERIASARNGLAVVAAVDQSCQACHVMLRPQLFNDVKTNQQVITCESCNRILYYPSAQPVGQ